MNIGKDVVETKVFMPVVQTLLSTHAGDMEWLARRCGVKSDSLINALSRDEIEFDLADLILCRLNAVHAWRTEPLAEIYMNVKLSDRRPQMKTKTVARPVPVERLCWWCAKAFTPIASAVGDRQQKYCAVKCRRAAARNRTRLATQ